MRLPRDSKKESFHRQAEMRVKKILYLFRLLGNLSWMGNDVYSREQVERIFATLQLELAKTKTRFQQKWEKAKKRNLLSEPSNAQTGNPALAIPLPDGTCLRATAFPDFEYPCVNIYWDNGINDPTEPLCFVEFNPEKDGEQRVCIGVYRSDQEDTAYYAPYIAAERTSNDE